LIDMTDANYMNDNNDPWISLAAATARLLKLDEQQTENSERDPKAGRSDEEKRSEERAYIEQRLRELSEWEQRIRDNRLKRVIRR
jgi:hypothetical protein